MEHDILKHNIQNLNSNDIAIVSYLGSGSSLLGGILIELGLDYIEGYQERIVPNKKETEIANPYWRNHWQQLEKKYADKKIESNAIRLLKAHYYPDAFSNSALQKAILLVRDARDAVISYYNWRLGFSDEAGTLHDFLDRRGYFDKKPFEDWADYAEQWIEWGKTHDLLIVRYEDLKFLPEKTVSEILSFLDVSRSDDAIKAAIEESCFLKVRKKEDVAAENKTSARIFRKGLVGEWRRVLSKDDLSFITPKTEEYLEYFGYVTQEKLIKKPHLTIVGVNAVTAWASVLCASMKMPQVILDGGGAEVLENKIRNIYPRSVVKAVASPFTVAHLDSVVTGPVLTCSDNEELIRSLQEKCELDGYPLIRVNEYHEDPNVVICKIAEIATMIKECLVSTNGGDGSG